MIQEFLGGRTKSWEGIKKVLGLKPTSGSS